MSRLLLCVAALLLASCDSTEPQQTTRAVTGTVTDLAGAPLAGAEVTVLGTALAATTDAQGAFRLEEVGATGSATLRFERTGYGAAFRVLDLAAVKIVAVRLKEAPAPRPIDVVAGGVVTEQNVEVAIEAGSLVLPGGAPATGTVEVHIMPYDPLEPLSFPASMMTNEGGRLISIGMAEIHITQGGERLQPAAGKTIGFTLDVPEGLAMAASYNLWYLNEQTGLWEDNGPGTWDEATRRWTAQLPHLSYPNGDALQANWADVNGTVWSGDHDRMSGAQIAAETNVGWGENLFTDASGGYAVRIPVQGGMDDPSVRALETVDQRPVNGPYVETFPTGAATTRDFQMCIKHGRPCKSPSSLCCDGYSCIDGYCL